MTADQHAPVDLLVVGGGINGTGIARDAVGRGLTVALCEMGDLAGATSNWSSKLIHGGLRYLEQYEFRLVRKALQERDTLLEAAPHLIRPLRFILPHTADQRPAWMIRAGLLLYDHLARRRHFEGSRRVRLADTTPGAALAPGLTRGFAYSDGWGDDARLVIANAQAAAQGGAAIHVRTRLVAAEVSGDGLWHAELVDEATGQRFHRTARALINAAGPWADQVARLGHYKGNQARTRLVKGSHIVVDRLHTGEEALILQTRDNRVVFVIPYEGQYSLVGTTDEPVEAPDSPTCSESETAYLCDVVNSYFQRQIGPGDVHWRYAGVRPLYDDGSGDPSAVTRGYVLALSGGTANRPLQLDVLGGKLTTYRSLAEEAVDKLRPWFPAMGQAWTAGAPLPGGDMPESDFPRFLAEFRKRHPWLPEALATRYARQFGTRADEVVGDARSLAGLGQDFGQGLHAREVAYLLDKEYARTAEDILWRRTKRGLHMSAAQQRALAAWLAEGAA